MANNLPYFPFYPADYITHTLHLTLAEHGAYLNLIGAQWLAGGPLPDDEKKLASLARATPEEWAQVRGTVLEFFTRVDGGFIQKRLAKEHDKAKATVEKRKKAGAASARARGTSKVIDFKRI